MTTIASLAVDVAVNPAGAILGIAALGVAIAGASVKMAGDFQQSMTQLVTSAGESKANLKMVGDGILAMAVETATSTQQLSSGMYMIESAGFHGAAGLNVLKLAAEGAKSENADLGMVANAVTSALNSYNYSADKAAFVTNVLVASTAAGKMHMQDLAGAVSNVLPATSKFKISLIDTTAAIATMTMQGDNASSAATHLRQMILALEAPSKAGAKALASIGLSSEQVAKEMSISLPDAIQMITDALGKKFPEGSAEYNQALKNISGGSKQLMGMLELSGTSLQKYKDNVAAVTKAVKEGGGSIMGWDLIQGNFNFKVAQFREVLQTAGITLGTFFLPLLGNLFDWLSHTITPALNGVNGLFGKLSKFFTDIPAHAQPLLTVSGGLKDAFNGIAKALQPANDLFDHLGNVLSPNATAVGNLGFATGQLATIMNGVPAKISPFTRILQFIHGVIVNDVLPAFRQIGTWINNEVVPALQSLWTYAQQNILPLWESIAQYIVATVVPALEKIGTWILTKVLPEFQKLSVYLLRQVVPTLQDLAKFITTWILPALQSIGTWITTQVVPALQKLWTYAQQNIIPILQDLAKYIVTNVLPVLEKLGTWILTKVLPVLESFFAWFAKSITPALQTLWTVISTQVIPGLQGIWDSIANKLIPAIQKLWDKISPVLIPLLNLLGWTFTNAVVPTIQAAIDNLAKFIDWIDKAITKIGDFFNKLGQMKDALGGIKDSVIDGITKNSGGHFGQQLGGHANGGFIDHTGWAMVGERGPEVVRLPTGSQVYPHGITPAGLTGGGGSHKTYNVNVYPQQVSLSEKALADELRWQDVIHGQ